MSLLLDSKTEVIAQLIAERYRGDLRRLLVVGCGSGLEAAILAQRLGTEVIGIDIEPCFDPQASMHSRLLVCDGRSQAFPRDCFDFVYSFHALEHIPQPLAAIREIHRVLRPAGAFFVGTPNRSRLIGYIGSKTATLRQKVRWNFHDWRARLSGRFRNELGAHAGFTSWELGSLLRQVFPETDEDTHAYYLRLYSHHRRFVRSIIATGLGRWVFPSVYFTGRKNESSSG